MCFRTAFWASGATRKLTETRSAHLWLGWACWYAVVPWIFCVDAEPSRLHLNVTIEDAEELLQDRETPSPMQWVEASEQAAALHQCLQKLDQSQRQVVSLAYLRDLSHSELASNLKLPLGTVKTWMRRSLEQLRKCMARHV